MALFGSMATVQAQLGTDARFAAAFGYLRELLRPGGTGARLAAAAPGETHRVELAAGAFALEQVYLSKRRPDGFFESHRTYIDVQVVVAGEEWMEVAGIDRLVVRQPYNADRDVIMYEDCGNASILRLQAGEAAVFFPVDGHMPALCGAGAPAIVRKTVIKVPVA